MGFCKVQKQGGDRHAYRPRTNGSLVWQIRFEQRQTVRPVDLEQEKSEEACPSKIDHMSKSTRNTGKPWMPAEVRQLKQLANENTPTRVMGLKLGRTEDAVRAKASEKGISLKPTNQSPHNRRN